MSEKRTVAAVIKNLDRALLHVEDAEKIIGQTIPPEIESWANQHGIAVCTSRYAPPDTIYLVGAIPIEAPDFLHGEPHG